MTDRMMNNRLTKLADIDAAIDALKAEAEALKAEIKSEMAERGVDEANTGKFIVRFKEIVSSKFDTTTFKKACPGMYGEYLKESVSKRFTYKAAC